MITFLVLDYNRPEESRLCLKSIKRFVKFPHTVTFLSNGGEQYYVQELYDEGLIDRLIMYKKNEGLGFGTTDLFKNCLTKYAFYLQNDQFFNRDFTERELNEIIGYIGLVFDRGGKSYEIKSVSVAGNPCNGEYSERAHIIETKFYNSIPNMPNGGAGPYHHLEWNEGFIQSHYKRNFYAHYIYEKPFIQDNGCFALRENPDGSKWKHRTDTKELWLLQGPVKERYVYPKFSDQEWNDVLSSQKWTEGKIPEQEKQHSFRFWP